MCAPSQGGRCPWALVVTWLARACRVRRRLAGGPTMGRTAGHASCPGTAPTCCSQAGSRSRRAARSGYAAWRAFGMPRTHLDDTIAYHYVSHHGNRDCDAAKPQPTTRLRESRRGTLLQTLSVCPDCACVSCAGHCARRGAGRRRGLWSCGRTPSRACRDRLTPTEAVPHVATEGPPASRLTCAGEDQVRGHQGGCF